MSLRGGRGARARQQGIVLLLVMLVLLSVASYALLRSLNVARQHSRASNAVSAASLAAAERALLGYAARYPDDPDSASLAAGPGHLPCPDTRFDAGDVPGQADPPCAIGGVNGTTGLLPWRTLDIPDLRDDDGAPLWYAVDDAFRNNPQGLINPDTVAALRLDNCGATGRDIAALIVAPGAALGGQDRSTANPAVRYAAANYLEGQNASTGDTCFSSAAGITANDVVRAIDRARLIDAVQGRVLRDVANALERYYRDPDGDDDNAGVDPDCAPLPGDCDDAYPWLSPYTDPSLGPYAGTVGTRAGLLPLRRVDVDFDAGFAAQWSIPVAGTVVGTGTSPPSASCVRDTRSPCPVSVPGFTAVVDGPAAGVGVGSCRWPKLESGLPGSTRLRCETRRSALDATSGNTLTRVYVVEIEKLPREIMPPTALAPRTEGATLLNSSVPAGGLIDLTVTDTLTSAAGVETALGEARLVLSAGAAVSLFALTDVPFDLEISDDDVIDPATRRSPGELPPWFAANGWQQFIAVAYAAAYAPGNAAADCTPGVDCLRLERVAQDGAATTLGDVRGLVLGAGPALATQARPSADPAQLFEHGNSSFDDVYTERPMAADSNDRVRRLGVDD